MYSNQNLCELIDILRKEETETEWLEFKSNYIPNQEIGEYISALSNGAALTGRPFGYLVFGIDDKTHEVIGTKFDYRKTKQGNEDLENWLNRLVEPKIGFTIYHVQYAALKNLVLLEIPAAFGQPTLFSGQKFVRIGSYKQNLSRYPEMEKRLWYSLSRVSFESETSPIQNLHFEGAKNIANYRGVEFSESNFSTLRLLDLNGKFNNLAFLLSDENPHLVKFAVYRNNMYDFAVKKEFTGSWIVILERCLEYLNLYNDRSARVIGSDATRTEIQNYPDPSLREIVVNAFAHFDATFPSDIKIEFYPDHVEIASPGSLYRTTMKEVLHGRQSFRNPNLVFLLNKFKYIENYATGLKKTFAAYAPYNLEPKFVSSENFFVVTLPNVNADIKDGETNLIDDTLKQNDTKNPDLDDTLKRNDTKNPDLDDTLKRNDTKNPDLDDTLNPGNIHTSSAFAVLQCLRKDSTLKIEEIAKETKLSQITVKRALAVLKEKGYIKRLGSKKRGSWKILR